MSLGTIAITYTISNYVDGVVRFQYGNINGGNKLANGTYTDIITGIGASTALNLYSLTASTNLSIDNISVVEIIQESADFTVQRNTVATRVNEQGLIEEVGVDVPRLNYSGGGCPTLLTEPSATNIVFWSEDLTQSKWVKSNVTISKTEVSILDGKNADVLIESVATNSLFGVYPQSRPTNLTLGETYYVSFFAKKINRDWCGFRDLNAFQNPQIGVFFNLSNGQVGSSLSGVLNPQMKLFTNGWYECSFSFVATNNISMDYRISSATVDNNYKYDGVIGTEAIAVTACQLSDENSSYIKTEDSATTRSADVISVTPPSGTTSIVITQDGIEQAPVTTIPPIMIIPSGNTNKIIMN